MAGILHRVDRRWCIERLATPHSLLHLSPVRVESFAAASSIEGPEVCVLMRTDSDRQWAAIVPENLRLLHNGQPIAAGLRMLAHRDSLALSGDEPVFLSTEEAARVETLTEPEPLTCPRCRCEILAGQRIVRCPACNVVHHELADRNCWTYAPACALCAYPTALDSALRWSPEEL